MRLRTTLALSFLAVALVQALVVPIAMSRLEALLSAQRRARVDGAMIAVGQTLSSWRQEVLRMMEALTDLEPSELTEARMRARGLSALSLLDERGVTLASGHAPGKLGDRDEALLEVTRAGELTLVIALVQVQRESGVLTLPALLAARRLTTTDGRTWAVGGRLLDEGTAAHLSRLANARVELRTAGSETLLAAAGQVDPSSEVRSLALPPAARVLFRFSRAEQRAASRQVLLSFAALFGAGLVLAVLAGFGVARRLTRPVEALTAAVAKLGRDGAGAGVETRASGELGALVAAFNRMTRDLSETTRRLLAAERIAAWQEVARRLAHELKNPLTPIKMSLETVRAAAHADHPHFRRLFEESADAVLEEVERLRRIVDEFSRFARLPPPVLASVDLSELVHGALSLHASGACRYELDATPHVAVRADRDQLTQVLLNLLRNAEEAMPTGGLVRVRVSSDASGAALAIEDEGGGVPAGDLERIFEPYVTTKPQGTGLGLAIARRICEEHGGTLTAENTAKGARFTVRLPSAEAALRAPSTRGWASP